MKWIVCLLTAIFSLAVAAQTDVPTNTNPFPSHRDATALTLLSRSLAAMGGSSLTTGGGITIQGQMTPAGNGSASTFQARYKLTGAGIAFRKEVTSARGTAQFASGGGNAVWRSADGKSGKFKSHVAMAALPVDVPLLVLAYVVNNSNFNVELISSGNSNSPAQVRIQDMTDAQTATVVVQDWYFDPTTALPIRVEYRLPEIVNYFAYQKGTCDYLGFQALSGVLVPAKTRCFEEKEFVSEEVIVSIDLNGSFEPNFDSVAGGLQ